MGHVILDVDSGERDVIQYPLPNDYTVKTNLPLYRVSNVKLVNARLLNCQTIINSGNNTLYIDGIIVTLPNGNPSNGAVLASTLQTALIGTNVTTVTFNSYSNTLTYANVGTGNNFTFQFFSGANGYSNAFSPFGPPADVMGFNGNDVSSTNGTLDSSLINMFGPTSIFLRLTCGGEDLVQSSYIDGGTFSFGNVISSNTSTPQIPPTYMGRIILNQYESAVLFTPTDHLISFSTPPDLNIRDIRVRLYWNNGTKFTPYDFGMINHILKFEFTCETDRFLKVYPEPSDPDELPKPIDEPGGGEVSTMYYVIAFVVLFLGFLMLIG
jgi:hypothetical protein